MNSAVADAGGPVCPCGAHPRPNSLNPSDGSGRSAAAKCSAVYPWSRASWKSAPIRRTVWVVGPSAVTA